MASNRTPRVQYHCSFCGKNQDQVKRLIAGPGAVYICDECVEMCMAIVLEHRAKKRPPLPHKVDARFDRTQREIEYEIDRWIDRFLTLMRLP